MTAIASTSIGYPGLASVSAPTTVSADFVMTLQRTPERTRASAAPRKKRRTVCEWAESRHCHATRR